MACRGAGRVGKEELGEGGEEQAREGAEMVAASDSISCVPSLAKQPNTGLLNFHCCRLLSSQEKGANVL